MLAWKRVYSPLIVVREIYQIGDHLSRNWPRQDTSLVACVVEGEGREAEYSGDIDDIDDDLGFEEEEDAGLADALDAVDLADNSRGDGVDEDDVFSDED